jgi:hypothetical protein
LTRCPQLRIAIELRDSKHAESNLLNLLNQRTRPAVGGRSPAVSRKIGMTHAGE